MKTLSEICILGKEEYINGSYLGKEQYLGMCVAMHQLFMNGVLTYREYDIFQNEYEYSIRGKDVFFLSNRNITEDRGEYAWTPSNRQARINWFNKRII